MTPPAATEVLVVTFKVCTFGYAAHRSDFEIEEEVKASSTYVTVKLLKGPNPPSTLIEKPEKDPA